MEAGMKKDWRLTVLYIVIAILFAMAAIYKTLTTPLLWLTALIFLGLGIYRLVKPLMK
jgi:hypothetical protein